MQNIVDRILLLMLSYILFLKGQDVITTLVYFYVLLALCSFLYCSKAVPLTVFFLVLYGCLIVLKPIFLFSAPILFCDYKKLRGKYRYGWLSLLPILLFLPGLPPETLVLYAFFSLLSWILYHKSDLITRFSKDLIITRDTSAELQMALEEKNRTLIAKQDTEIHLTRLQERNRIAREIHDNVGHLLTRSILQTRAISAICRDDNLKEPISQVSDTLNQAMDNIRSSVHDLHDESIDLESGIRQALSCLSDFQLHFDYDVSAYIPKEIKYALIAIAKETANNIVKHSNGTKAFYTLREHPALYQFSIEDNGTIKHQPPFDPEAAKGIGLQNIRTRVENLNGHLNINTENGFHIFITLPKKK